MILGPAFDAVLRDCPLAAETARPLFGARVLRLYQAAAAVAGLVPSRVPPTPGRAAPGVPASPNESLALVDHWRTHLTAMCALTTAPGAPEDRVDGVLASGVDLIRLVIPFLASEQVGLRDAVVSGLGHVHAGLYRTLLDSMQAVVRHLAEERKARVAQPQGLRRSKRFDRLHVSVARIYELSAKLLRRPDAVAAPLEPVLGPLLLFVRETLHFFRDPDQHDDPTAVNMRRSYCNTVAAVVDCCAAHDVVEAWLPAELLCDLFAVFDHWSFRPLSPVSPEVGRGTRSVESHGHGTTKSRGSSLASTTGAFEVYLPAVNAIVALCESKRLPVRREVNDRNVVQLEAQDVLRWAQALFEQINPAGHAAARRALYALLAHNAGHRLLLDLTAYQCFAEPETLHLQQSTWSVLSDAILAVPTLGLKPSTLLCLVLWKMGHPDLQTRQRAVDVLALELPSEARAGVLARCETALYCSFSGAALRARREAADVVARAHDADARAVFLELTIRILQIGTKQTRMLLQLLPPFVANLRLPAPDRRATEAVLANLFLLGAKYGDTHHAEMRELWATVASGGDGADFAAVVRFLVDETVRRGSKEFARHAQRVVGCLCESERAAALLQELADLVQPSDMAGAMDVETTPLAGHAHAGPRRTNLDTLFPVHTRRLASSPAQAALLLVGDALIGRLSTADPAVPRLLHGLLVAVDHSTPFIRAHARDCLLRCLTLLGKLPDAALPPSELRWRAFWEHDDLGLDASADHAPANMRALVDEAVARLAARLPDVRRLWGAVALEWATSCPIRHVACRSFQAFRVLGPAVSQRMLADMLARLSSTMADESTDNQLFAREVVWTVSSLVRDCDVATIVELPQLVWATSICLDTTVETEFCEAAFALDCLLQRMDGVNDKALDAALEASRPTCCASPGPRLALLVAQKGLRSSTSCTAAYGLLRTLAHSSRAPLLAPPAASLPMLYATAMLFGLQALEDGKVDADLEAFATRLAATADALDMANVARILTSLAKNRFRTKDDFVRQATGNLLEYLSVAERVDVMLLFLSVLLNPLPWIRLRALTLLKAFAKQGCLADADADALPSDALRPLLDLLGQSDYAKAALEVMDEALPGARAVLTRPSARPGTGNSRRARNASLSEAVDRSFFGDVLASGWSAPTSKTVRQGVRHRLREVVESCSGGAPGAVRGESPISFAVDDFDTSAGGGELVAASDADASTLGDMVDALHDLGSFFEDGASVASASSTPAPVERAAEATPSFRMSQALGSASRVAAVLSRSLKSASPSAGAHGRTASLGAPRMATIAESSGTPFTAAFADAGPATPRVGTSAPLQRYNSDGLSSASSAVESSPRRHRRRGTRDTLSSDSEGDSAWGDEGSSSHPNSASSHENVRMPAGLAFTPVRAWDPAATLSDGDDEENVFALDDHDSPAGHYHRRRTPFLRMKPRASPSPHRQTSTPPQRSQLGTPPVGDD